MYLNICLLGKQDKNQNQKCKQPTQLFVYQTCANESNNGRFKDGGGTITLMIVTKTHYSMNGTGFSPKKSQQKVYSKLWTSTADLLALIPF